MVFKVGFDYHQQEDETLDADSTRLDLRATREKKKEKYLIRWFACLWLSKVCRRIKLTFSERVHLKYHFRRVQKPFEVFLAKRPWFISAIRPTWISENLVQTQEERGGERRMMERLKSVCLVSQARDAYGIFEKSTSTLQGLLVESYKCVYICSFVSLRVDRKNFKRIYLSLALSISQIAKRELVRTKRTAIFNHSIFHGKISEKIGNFVHLTCTCKI